MSHNCLQIFERHFSVKGFEKKPMEEKKIPANTKTYVYDITFEPVVKSYRYGDRIGGYDSDPEYECIDTTSRLAPCHITLTSSTSEIKKYWATIRSSIVKWIIENVSEERHIEDVTLIRVTVVPTDHFFDDESGYDHVGELSFDHVAEERLLREQEEDKKRREEDEKRREEDEKRQYEENRKRQYEEDRKRREEQAARKPQYHRRN